MNKKHLLRNAAIAVIFLIPLIGGCRSAPESLRSDKITCEEQLRQSVTDLKPWEISSLLDEARERGDIEGCWTPLMKKYLNEGIEIPHSHLKFAVKAFNQIQHKNYFHKAVVRYFNEMVIGDAEERATYRSQDKAFLTAYIRYNLRNCSSRDCPPLETSKQICSRLDPDLYSKFFE